MCNISFWCMRISQKFYFFCDYRFQIFFLASFLSSVSPLFHSRYLLRCIFFLAAVKSWLLIMTNYGQGLEMGPDQLHVSHFVAFFAPKRIALFFRMRSICKTDCCVDRSNQALLSAYQEWRRYLFTNIDVIFAHARKVTCTCGWQKLFRPGQILYSQTNFQRDFRQVSILAFPLNLNSEALS